MKKSIAYLLLLTICTIFFIVFQTQITLGIHNIIYYSPCNSPITYKIGEVDPQFNLTADQFLFDTKEASGIWNNAEGKNLLAYNPIGTLTVNLIFDGRQQVSNEISNLNAQLQTEKNQLDPKIAEYNRLSQQFQSQLDQFKSEADYWNSRGGAPPDEYQKLTAEQKSLQSQAATLDQMAQALNISTGQYNNKITQLNQSVDTYNLDLQFKPEEGVYNPNTNSITIYFSNNHAELIHTLAHELGHALGLQHNENQRSIMYKQTSQTLTPTTDDLTALQAICQEEPLWILMQQKLRILLQKTQPVN